MTCASAVAGARANTAAHSASAAPRTSFDFNGAFARTLCATRHAARRRWLRRAGDGGDGEGGHEDGGCDDALHEDGVAALAAGAEQLDGGEEVGELEGETELGQAGDGAAALDPER